VVGGIIGAIIGIALHVVLETGMLGTRVEASWFAVVIGVLTGLGVRQANRHHMERSYARGAVSGLIALAAIVASSFAIKEVMARKETQAKTGTVAAAAPANAEAEEEEPVAQAEPAAGRLGPVGGVGKGRPSDFSPWSFVFMALGALVAYELGRGIDHSKRAEPVPGEPGPAGEPMGRATDPSE
jgi:hypothetical protein